MLELSVSWSRPWARLSYKWGDVLTFNTTIPELNGANSVTTVNDLYDIERWPGSKVEIHVTPKNEIFMFLVDQGSWLEAWHGSERVGVIEYEKLTPTIVNIIEFYLGWENRKSFFSEYLVPAMSEPETPKGKKGWFYSVGKEMTVLRYGKDPKEQHWKPFSLSQLKCLLIIPELPVEIGLNNKNEVCVFIPKLSKVAISSMLDKSLSPLPVRCLIPAASVTSSVLSDTISNLVKNDSKQWLRSLINRSLDSDMIISTEDLNCVKYHESVGKDLYPNF